MVMSSWLGKVNGEVRHAVRQEHPSMVTGFDPQDGAGVVFVTKATAKISS